MNDSEKFGTKSLRIDAKPTRAVTIDDPDAMRLICEFLDEYISGSAIWLDSPQIAPRLTPLYAATAEKCIALIGTELEFIVVRDDDPLGFRAVTEEEYEWYLYASDAKLA